MINLSPKKAGTIRRIGRTNARFVDTFGDRQMCPQTASRRLKQKGDVMASREDKRKNGPLPLTMYVLAPKDRVSIVEIWPITTARTPLGCWDNACLVYGREQFMYLKQTMEVVELAITNARTSKDQT